MQKNINIGLIGAGKIAGQHLKAISKIKRFKILAISDFKIDKTSK